MTDTKTPATTTALEADRVTATVDAYLAMWNEPDATRRLELIAEAWTDDGHYLDPLLESQGPQGLSDMVETVHAHYPGQRFRRTSAVDVHHNLARFAWELAVPEGAVTVAGLDVATLAADGRLQAVTGFFGDLAPA